ncbi:MAG: 23S rRNA (pseudouridine(1915)-N(3))-methyltransferase RlmH [Ruminococcus sp.]|nr:23S rRNA (pseudouridine(1915)-N(3))-methyltransferase RlmH [Ruminococcus sp.]
MLNVNIICIGSLKEKFFSDAVNEYKKRLQRYCKFNIIELSEEKITDQQTQAQIDKTLSKEGEKILSKIGKSDFVFAMCIEGKFLSSEELSQKLNDVSLSYGTVDFVIGGSWGLSDEVKKRADFKLSVSKMTFPHQLFRVMLSEQIYRAFTISANAKYHK